MYFPNVRIDCLSIDSYMLAHWTLIVASNFAMFIFLKNPIGHTTWLRYYNFLYNFFHFFFWQVVINVDIFILILCNRYTHYFFYYTCYFEEWCVLAHFI